VNKSILKKLSAILLAAAMVLGTALMPSDVAEAAETYTSMKDYYDKNYPNMMNWAQYDHENWLMEKGITYQAHITATADPNTDSPAQSFDKADDICSIILKPGYTGDISWTYTEYNGYKLDLKDKPWFAAGGSYYNPTDIPMYGYSSETADSMTLRVHIENYNGLEYTMYAPMCINNTYFGELSAWIHLENHFGENFAYAAPARTAADEAAYQAAGGDAAYMSNASANTSSNTSSTTGSFSMYRFRHPTTGEHLYTASAEEAANVKKAGWIDETPAGGAWKAPTKSSAPIYRLYNPNKKTYNHLYSMNQTEMANLTKAGWKVEGVAYYSDTNKGVPVYREYNKKTGDHNYTTSLAEHNQLAASGWTAEGVAWYGVK